MSNPISSFNNIIQTYYGTQEKLASLGDAKKKRQREDEAYEIDKKTAELKLEKAKLEGQMTENDYHFQKTQMDEYFKQNKKIQEGKTAQINMTEQKLTDEAKMAQAAAAEIVKREPLVQDYVGQMLEPVTVGGHVGFRRRQAKAKTLKDTDNYQIFEAANKMASEDMSDTNMPYDEKVKQYLPKAREMLLGTTQQPEAKSKKIRMKDTNGTIGYIAEDKVEEAKKRGAVVVE